MSVLLSHSRSSILAAAEELRDRTRMVGSWWHAPNGTVWPLHTYNPGNPSMGGGGALLLPGVEGLGLPDYTEYVSATNQPGQLFRGARALPRQPWWPIALWSSSRAAWHGVDELFWEGMHPDPTIPGQAYGTWEWQGPAGQSRFLDMRYSETTDEPQSDPHRRQEAVYGIRFTADQPYWRGAPISRTFSPSVPVNWLPTATKPIWISSGASLTEASISNPGAVPAYPTWRVVGPASGVQFGVNGRLFTLPWVFADGAWVELSMVPGPRFGAWDHTGANRTSDMTSFQPEPIPAGGETSLTVQMTGAGSVTASLVPLYRRAW